MKQQILYKLLRVLLFLSIFTITLMGCSKPTKDDTTKQSSENKNGKYDYTGYTDYTEEGLGTTVKLPTKYMDDSTIVPGRYEIMFGDLDDLDKDKAESDPDAHLDIYFMPEKGEYALFKIFEYPESKWDGWMNSGKKPSEITKGSTTEELGRKDGTIYIYSEYPVDTSSFDDGMKASYNDIVAMLPAIKASINVKTVTMDNLSSFSTKDTNNKAVDNTIFSGHKLTMINIWATFCKPCIKELPDLQEMSKNMPEGTQMISLVGDVIDSDSLKLAQDIMKGKGFTITSLVPDESIKSYMDKNLLAYPTTIFVDSEGKIVGEPIVGERSVTVYKQVLNERLAKLSS